MYGWWFKKRLDGFMDEEPALSEQQEDGNVDAVVVVGGIIRLLLLLLPFADDSFLCWIVSI